jgi:CRP/FNR family cyclic AMP-dependent transcriptional regulator
VDDSLLEELPPASAGRLLELGARRTYRSGSYVFHESDRPDSVFLVERGMVRVDRTLRSGRRVLLTLVTEGSLVGELSVIDATPRSATAAAVRDSVLVVVPAARFCELLVEDGDLARVLLERVTRRLRALTDQFVETAAHGAASRVASRLVELLRAEQSTMRPPVELHLPITQEELAHWAGLSREGAVKGLGELREAGVISTARRKIVVHDPAALDAAALGSV